MRHEHTLDPVRTALVVMDMQESFRTVISDFAETTARIAVVTHGAQLLGVPIIITEQYPKGLGRTAGELRAVLPNVEPIEKTTFSACGVREFTTRLEQAGVYQVILCGIEAHICINQTALDLLAEGYQVHFLTDCISARAAHSKHVAFQKMQASGALPSSTELALFELMRDAKHEQFKAVQKLVK